MATHELKVKVVDAKPAGPTYEPFTLFLVKEPTQEKAKFFKSNLAGDELTPFGDEIDDPKVIHRGDAVPEGSPKSGFPLWYHTDLLKTFVNLAETLGVDDDVWVDSNPVPTLPAFGGNGEAETMARSDHWHDGARVVNPTW